MLQTIKDIAIILGCGAIFITLLIYVIIEGIQYIKRLYYKYKYYYKYKNK